MGFFLSAARICFLLLVLEGFAEGTTSQFKCEVDPKIPENISKHHNQPLCKGYLDVTLSPYNAKGDGKHDDTAAIQLAVEDAFHNQLVAFFPADKRFLISDQISLIKTKRTSLTAGYQLLGSTKGKPPVLVLKDAATVKDNIFVYFALLDPNFDAPNHYGAMIRNIHIEMGNNPQVIALSMSGAQYCSIEDVVISGEQFYAGIQGLPGSGGFSGNIEITGGQIGIWQQQYRPVPSVTNVVLVGQNVTGVLLEISRGPLLLSGFSIVSPEEPSPDYRAITQTSEVGRHGMSDDGDGALALEDGSIQVKGGVAIQSYGSNIALKNVYVQASTVLEMSARKATTPGDRVFNCSDASLETWNVIDWVFTTSQSTVWEGPAKLTNNQTFSYPSADVACIVSSPPPLDLVSTHAWNFSAIPSWEDTDLVDIVLDYGATPDWVSSNDDDGVLIQQALNDTATKGHPKFGYTVFIPYGTFRIANTLEVPAGSRILGSGKFAMLSVQNKYFDNWSQDTPMIRTEDSKAPADGYGLVLADFVLHSFARGTYINIRTDNTLLKWVALNHGDVSSDFKFDADGPYSIFSGNAGGRVYGITPGPVNFDQINSDVWSQSFTLLMVNGTSNPLHFYQTSIEHQPAFFEFLVEQSSHVHVHGFKFESVGIGATPPAGSHPVVGGGLMAVRHSHDVTIFGGCGNFGLSAANVSTTIIEIVDSDGFDMRAVNRRPQEGEIKGTWITNGAAIAVESDFSVLFYSDAVKLLI